MLGTGHDEPVRFLTAEDKLLELLQLTGVLVNAQGQVALDNLLWQLQGDRSAATVP